MKIVALLVALLVTGTAQAAMLCARPRSDGTFSTTIKLREACKSNEVELGIVTLDPLRLFGPTTTTSTSSSVTSTSSSSTTSTTTLDQDLAFNHTSSGLMIELKRNGSVGANFADPHDIDNEYTWTDSGDGDDTDPDGTLWTDFLVKLNTPPCFAGHCDWRVPTISELLSLNPTMGTPYPGPYGYFWSSTEYSALSAHTAGLEPSAELKTTAQQVRAVRTLP